MRSIIFKIAIVSLLVSLIGITWVSLAFASAPTVAANYPIPTSASISVGTSYTVMPPVSLVSASATTAIANSPIPTSTSISIGTSCTVIP